MSAEQLSSSQPDCSTVLQRIVSRVRRNVANLVLVPPAFASLFQAGIPASVHAEDYMSRTQSRIESQWLPPPTGPRTQEEQYAASLAEVRELSSDMQAIADAVKTWVHPNLLQKYPALNFENIVNDPEQLKAYQETKHLIDVTLYADDIRTVEDRVVLFLPEGPGGSKQITIYKRSDGTVYKVIMSFMADGNAAFITQFLRPGEGIPADKLPSITEALFNIDGVNLTWGPGEGDRRAAPRKKGEGTVGDWTVSTRAVGDGIFMMIAANLKGSEQRLTEEEKAAREQRREEMLRAERQKIHDETRKPPVPDNSRAALTDREADHLIKNLILAVDIAKQWFNPEVLLANPALTDISAAVDPEKLKAYRDRGYIIEESGQVIPDAIDPNDKIITFQPYGQRGGIAISIYQSADGKIYKGRIFAAVAPDGSLTSGFLPTGKISRDDLPRAIERLVRLPKKVQWQPGEDNHVIPHLRAAGKIGDIYFVEVEGSSSGSDYGGFMKLEFEILIVDTYA